MRVIRSVSQGKGFGEFRDGWPVVLSAMLGVGLGPFYTMGNFAPALAREFGWSFGQILVSLPILTLMVLLMSPVVGLLADRFGVRPIALGSSALFGLVFMSLALSNGSLPLFYATWACMALFGAGSLPITWTRAVNARFDRRKGLALGLSLLGTGLFGFTIKPIAAHLIAQHGWRVAYLAIGSLPLLIAVPFGLWGFHESHDPESHAERRARLAAHAASTPGVALRDSLRDWRFWVMGLSFIPVSFGVGGPIPNMENILKLHEFSAPDVIGLTQLIGLSVLAGRIVGGWLIDRFWAPGVAFFLLSAPAAACWAFARPHLSYAGAAAGIGTIGFAAGVEYDLMAFLVARYFGMRSYASIYGTLYGFFALGAGIGPVVFGRTFDRTGSYGAVLLASATLLFFGALLLLTLGRYRRFEMPA
jgi:MFS family permease